MPGFILGVQENNTQTMMPIPKAPVYTYTWRMDKLANLVETKMGEAWKGVYARDINLPDFGFDTEEYQSPSIRYKYAKGIAWSDVKITFYDTLGLYKVIEHLRQQVWTPDEGLKPAATYKSLSKIEVYLGDDRSLESVWYMYNSWVKTVNWSSLTYTSSDVHNVTVTLAYDWAEAKSK